MLGFEREDNNGILISLALLKNVAQKEEEYQKTNKKKQDSRRARAPVRRPKKGLHH